MIDTSGIRLPAELWDALEDLYEPDRRQEWLTRYAVSCRRTRLSMRYLALKQAGYPTEIAQSAMRLTHPR
jgi:hypothetical protein